jgi:hypothetical protein
VRQEAYDKHCENGSRQEELPAPLPIQKIEHDQEGGDLEQNCDADERGERSENRPAGKWWPACGLLAMRE